MRVKYLRENFRLDFFQFCRRPGAGPAAALIDGAGSEDTAPAASLLLLATLARRPSSWSGTGRRIGERRAASLIVSAGPEDATPAAGRQAGQLGRPGWGWMQTAGRRAAPPTTGRTCPPGRRPEDGTRGRTDPPYTAAACNLCRPPCKTAAARSFTRTGRSLLPVYHCTPLYPPTAMQDAASNPAKLGRFCCIIRPFRPFYAFWGIIGDVYRPGIYT